MRRVKPGCGPDPARPAPYAVQSNRASGCGVVDGHAAADVHLGQRDAGAARPVPADPTSRPATASCSGASRPLARWAWMPRSRSCGACRAERAAHGAAACAGSRPNGVGGRPSPATPSSPPGRPAGSPAAARPRPPGGEPGGRRPACAARTRSPRGSVDAQPQRRGDLGRRSCRDRRRPAGGPGTAARHVPVRRRRRPRSRRRAGERARIRLGVGLGRVVQLDALGQRGPDGGRVRVAARRGRRGRRAGVGPSGAPGRAPGWRGHAAPAGQLADGRDPAGHVRSSRGRRSRPASRSERSRERARERDVARLAVGLALPAGEQVGLGGQRDPGQQGAAAGRAAVLGGRSVEHAAATWRHSSGSRSPGAGRRAPPPSRPGG